MRRRDFGWSALVVAACAVALVLAFHHRPAHAPRPVPAPVVAVGVCDHGFRVWPGTGVFPDPTCPTRPETP